MLLSFYPIFAAHWGERLFSPQIDIISDRSCVSSSLPPSLPRWKRGGPSDGGFFVFCDKSHDDDVALDHWSLPSSSSSPFSSWLMVLRLTQLCQLFDGRFLSRSVTTFKIEGSDLDIWFRVLASASVGDFVSNQTPFCPKYALYFPLDICYSFHTSK